LYFRFLSAKPGASGDWASPRQGYRREQHRTILRR
jgi:hypothetical protein